MGEATKNVQEFRETSKGLGVLGDGTSEKPSASGAWRSRGAGHGCCEVGLWALERKGEATLGSWSWAVRTDRTYCSPGRSVLALPTLPSHHLAELTVAKCDWQPEVSEPGDVIHGAAFQDTEQGGAWIWWGTQKGAGTVLLTYVVETWGPCLFLNNTPSKLNPLFNPTWPIFESFQWQNVDHLS